MLQVFAEVNVTHADLKLDNMVLVDRSPQDAVFSPELELRMFLEEKARNGVGVDEEQECRNSLVPNFVKTAYSLQNWTKYGAAPPAEVESDVEDVDVVTSRVALIGFGAAYVGNSCLWRTQTTFCRAPEVVLRLRYDPAIDMW
ncbi:protein kinase domain [Trypanosoma rangeli]|uniref:Protein kinase domain n=1 Tax=Trypanosoma rangeli TaxID=5698 RepID=A0A3R7LNM3_TRYRA|nr:protein kinase domain [Trypanosoma rangeli]RNF00442.1 protein kinase domain [Trypanosoma rangeli]|eukprot:RNF00442.1 protein kinase domain [Trypanosoma rangeli]